MTIKRRSLIKKSYKKSHKKSHKKSRRSRRFGDPSTDITKAAADKFKKRLGNTGKLAGFAGLNLDILSDDYNKPISNMIQTYFRTPRDVNKFPYLMSLEPIVHAAILNFLLYPDTLIYTNTSIYHGKPEEGITKLINKIISLLNLEGTKLTLAKQLGPTFANFILSEDLKQEAFKNNYIERCEEMKRCEAIHGIPSLINLIKPIIVNFEKGAYKGLEPLIHAALLNHYIHPETEEFTKKFY